MTDTGDRIHVLLVDDEEAFLTATATALQRRQFVVRTASDGNAAIVALQRETFDVVVLDVKMPGISGDDLFHMIKARWPEIPVVMLTGHGSFQHAFSSSREGVVEYLAKPCEIERFASVLWGVVAQGDNQGAEGQDASTDPDIRVLVVDDEQELLDVVERMLGRRGMKVATAKDAEHAFERLASEGFDVVLVDLRLRGESGLDLLDRIRRNHPSVEVIVQTGQPTAQSAVEALHRGAFDYLIKPVDSRWLLNRIRAAHHHRLRRTEESHRRVIQDILARQPD